MSVSFKLTFIGEDGERETRRVLVENDACKNLASLKEKLVNVFPNLKTQKNFTLYWSDDENDNITITSDDDLVVAMTAMKGPVYKLFIKTGNKKLGGVQSLLHPGVLCDGCDGGVVGYRYKCLTCPDYDLCAVCEMEGKHSNHVMIRIVKQEQQPGGHQEDGQEDGQEVGQEDGQEDGQEVGQEVGQGNEEQTEKQETQAVPTLKRLRKDLIKTKEVLENVIGNEKLKKETHDPIEQAASFLNMDPDNLKQIGDLIKGFGVNFVFEKNNENSEESCEQVGSSTEKDFNKNEKEGKETNGNGTFIGKDNQKNKSKESELCNNGLMEVGSKNDDGLGSGNSKVNKAFKEMQKMGFTNEGGWLIKLLEAKSGDIPKTMQALKLD